MARPISKLRRLVSDEVWRLGKDADFAWRYLTRRGRCLPDFLVIGAQRSGTTAVHEYLTRHPSIHSPFIKEVHYFDLHYAKGPDWYRAHFALGMERALSRRLLGHAALQGEASPSYLFFPETPQRVQALIPGVKLVALLRDPVARAYSHYHLIVRRWRETLSFEQSIDRELAQLAGREEELLRSEAYVSENRVRYSYLARGLYALQLENWLAHCPPGTLRVLRAEDYFADPQGTLDGLFAFLGLPPHPVPGIERINAQKYPTLNAETERRLRDYYAPFNARLERLLGRDMGW